MTRTPHSGRAQQTQEEGRGAPGGRGVHGRRGRAAHVELLPLGAWHGVIACALGGFKHAL